MPGSIATNPTSIAKGALIVLSLVGTETGWGGGTTFSFQSDTSGSSITSQAVIDATHATVTIQAGSTLGSFVLWDNGAVRSNAVSVFQIVGQVDALALAVVAWLNSGVFTVMGNPTPQTFCLPISAERRFTLIDDLTGIPAYDQPVSVDVFPDIETSRRSEKSIAPVFISEYVIHVFIQQQLSGSDEEAQCALLVQLRSQIIEGLKVWYTKLPDAVHPVTSNVFPIEIMNMDRGFRGKGLYSMDRLLQQHVFESDTILIFKAAA